MKKDLVQETQLWQKIWPIRAFLERHDYVPAVESAMEMQELRTDGVTRSSAMLVEKHSDKLNTLLTDL